MEHGAGFSSSSRSSSLSPARFERSAAIERFEQLERFFLSDACRPLPTRNPAKHGIGGATLRSNVEHPALNRAVGIPNR
jgi:hypothetical protein